MKRKRERVEAVKARTLTGIYQIEKRRFVLLDVTKASNVFLLPNMRAMAVAVLPWADYRKLLRAAKSKGRGR